MSRLAVAALAGQLAYRIVTHVLDRLQINAEIAAIEYHINNPINH